MEKKNYLDERFMFHVRRSTTDVVSPRLSLPIAQRILLMILRWIAFALIVMGTLIFILSLMNHRSYPVLGQPIHGSIWGSVIVLLGVRYVGAVHRLYQKLIVGNQSAVRTPVVQKGAL